MPNAFVRGIDVSSNQGDIDWNAVSQSDLGFAFSRATIGGHQTDSQFRDSWNGIRNFALMRGAYHYFWPLTPWQEQATNFTGAVGALESGDLPPVLDLEEAFLKTDPHHDVWADITYDERLPMIQNWLNEVLLELGMRPIVYTRQNFIERLLGDGVEAISDSLLWIEHYDVPEPRIPKVWSSWHFWQQTDTGEVDGIRGHVDLDGFSGSAADLRALSKR
jgi:lysozyme